MADMIFRLLDGNDDWVFGQGLASYAQQNNAIALNIKTRIKEWVGNCFFNMSGGIDWATRLGRNQEADLLADLKTIIIQSEGVVRANQVSANLDRRTRRLTVSYNIDTIYSQAFSSTIEGALGVAT